MAFGILQAFLKRVETHGLLSINDNYAHILRQYQAHNNNYESIEIHIREEERPPMVEIPEYRKKYNISD